MESVKEAPPAQKLVYLVLDEEGPLTLTDIQKETRLPYSTTRHAVLTLEAGEKIARRPHIYDTRKSVFHVR